MIRSFPPIEPQQAYLLVLGTMPSVRSLTQSHYYGHPQNQFWKMIYALWGLPSPEDYESRVRFLKEKHIALWDVLKACEREGSMDSNIKAPAPNDIPSFVERHPELHTILFNSKNAQILFEKLITPKNMRPLCYRTLPSSSPARAMKFEDKLAHWSIVRQLLEKGPDQ